METSLRSHLKLYPLSLFDPEVVAAFLSMSDSASIALCP